MFSVPPRKEALVNFSTKNVQSSLNLFEFTSEPKTYSQAHKSEFHDS